MSRATAHQYNRPVIGPMININNPQINLAGDDSIAIDSAARKLQLELMAKLTASNDYWIQDNKLPIKWTLLGVVIASSAFWFAIYKVFIG